MGRRSKKYKPDRPPSMVDIGNLLWPEMAPMSDEPSRTSSKESLLGTVPLQ
ncbi:Hypothetical predicted protein, partial [Pelobates cultripes]